MSSPRPSFSCPDCPRTFARPEHLRRHQQQHRNKRHACSICGKRFHRSDVLNRHRAAVHNALPVTSGDLDRLPRACRQCASARVRCTKESICLRCADRGLECEYPLASSASLNENAMADASHTEHAGSMGPMADDMAPMASNGDIRSASSNGYQDHHVATQFVPTHLEDTCQAGSQSLPQGMLPVPNPPPSGDWNGQNFGDLLTTDMNWLPANLDADLTFDFFDMQSPSFFDQPVPTMISQHSTSTPEALTNTGSTTVGQVQEPEMLVIDQTHISDSSGALYATSNDGARAPFGMPASPNISRARSRRPLTLNSSESEPGKHSYSFPFMTELDEAIGHQKDTTETRISDTVYTDIKQTFTKLCFTPLDEYEVFKTAEFPTKRHLECLLALYSEKLAEQIPLQSTTTVRLNDCPELVMAIAGLGAMQAESPHLAACDRPMLELCRRATNVGMEKYARCMPPLEFLQALVLLQIGLLYGSSLDFIAYALDRHATLIRLGRKLHLFEDTISYDSTQQTSRSENEAWLGYMIWLLDSMIETHFHQPSLLTVEDAQAPLPTEKQNDSTSRSPTLHRSVSRLFTHRQFDRNTGRFGQLLMLHGIRSEVMAVERFHKRALSSWTPSQNIPCISHPSNRADDGRNDQHRDWLPSDPAFAKWRNAACDCMDILHWQANSVIAANFGKEHDTVFHLHFARIALLVPLREIECLVSTFGNSVSALLPHINTRPQDRRNYEQDILYWVRRDEHKARLSMLHVGALLWYVRRFSDNAFYEAKSVYLSILALWAYSTYTAGASSGHTSGAPGDPTQLPDISTDGFSRTNIRNLAASPSQSLVVQVTEDEELSFVRLDRPVDDEMAQIWVRTGQPGKMTALISGVGDINARQAPLRILALGQKLLTGYAQTWQVATYQVQVLERLFAVISNYYS
ncbi:hypothetical protein BDZ85DRAFT_97477 [Elsinoe ampelina]|uniref:Fungal-specific transcription factor domain-containing protein n=1 Tax=Elsinoe ampelina TaxID=302913 RepID=A0A6A6GED1_9PEZI|nr:hypothetical protein BDZ85DRAFT_97477 [Elsinoe ampelina]